MKQIDIITNRIPSKCDRKISSFKMIKESNTALTGKILVNTPAELAETLDNPSYINRKASTVTTIPKYNIFIQSHLPTDKKSKCFAS